MQFSKKMFLIMVVLIFTHLAVYFLTLKVEHNKHVKVFNEEMEKYEIDMALMHYEKYREIFSDIQGEKVDLAKCNAELAASSLMESMDYCKDNSFCTNYIETRYLDTRVKIIASELTGIIPSIFKRRKSCP